MNLENKNPKDLVAQLSKQITGYTVPEKITSMEEYRRATDEGSKINQAKKDVEGIRDFFAKPHYKVYKEIRDMFAPFIDELETKEKQTKQLMAVWHREEQQRRDEEQKRIEAEALADAEEGEEISVPVVNHINTIEGASGRSQVRRVKKWRVVDIRKVPMEYLEVNKTLMNEAVKKGNVPKGIELYEEDSIAFSR